MILMRRMRKILHCKYNKDELNKVVDEQCQHLNPKERERLLNLLIKFEYLLDGTLCMWKTTLVDLELKDDATPVC